MKHPGPSELRPFDVTSLGFISINYKITVIQSYQNAVFITGLRALDLRTPTFRVRDALDPDSSMLSRLMHPKDHIDMRSYILVLGSERGKTPGTLMIFAPRVGEAKRRRFPNPREDPKSGTRNSGLQTPMV